MGTHSLDARHFMRSLVEAWQAGLEWGQQRQGLHVMEVPHQGVQG